MTLPFEISLYQVLLLQQSPYYLVLMPPDIEEDDAHEKSLESIQQIRKLLQSPVWGQKLEVLEISQHGKRCGYYRA